MSRIAQQGLRETEVDILALWDANLGSRAIAERLNLRERYVLDVLSRFENHDDWQDNARRASMRMHAAIVACGGSYA